eukprot:251036-Chlamydomonas_euryale.AAC.1
MAGARKVGRRHRAATTGREIVISGLVWGGGWWVRGRAHGCAAAEGVRGSGARGSGADVSCMFVENVRTRLTAGTITAGTLTRHNSGGLAAAHTGSKIHKKA